MPSINGTIEALSIKPMQPDNYGNTFRCSMKIGEDWYSYGTLNKAAINIKTGDSWTQLTKGMGVEFMYDVNGDFKNIKKKTFSITDTSGEVASTPQPSPAQGQSAPKGNFVNPAEIGQCLNLAAEVLGLDGEQLLDDKEVTKAIAWYKSVRAKFNELYTDVPVEAQPKPKAKPVVEDSYDDDEV